MLVSVGAQLVALRDGRQRPHTQQADKVVEAGQITQPRLESIPQDVLCGLSHGREFLCLFFAGGGQGIAATATTIAAIVVQATACARHIFRANAQERSLHAAPSSWSDRGKGGGRGGCGGNRSRQGKQGRG